MSSKVKVTTSLPEAEYAVGDKLSGGNLSAWIAKKIRVEAREKYGIDLDNLKPGDEAKIAKWISENTEKKRKHSKGSHGAVKGAKKTKVKQ